MTYQRPHATILARRLTEPRRPIEVKSGRGSDALPSMEAFRAAFKPHRLLLVGGDGIPVEEFLMQPVAHRMD